MAKPRVHIWTDKDVVDGIAALLGCANEWDSAADHLEWIADLITQVRHNPGGTSEPEDYAASLRPVCPPVETIIVDTLESNEEQVPW